jgi:hypothetical protein
MSELNSVLNKNSRYVSGGRTEVNPTALEWWERIPLPVNKDDTVYVVEKRFEGRLDQIAAVYLGEPRYWWVIAQYNNILDPYSEISEGAILYIPKIEKVKALMSGKTGGYPSEREVPLSILPIV